MGIIAVAMVTNVQAKTAEVMEDISPEEMLNIAKGFGSAELSNNGNIFGRIDGEKIWNYFFGL